MSDLALIWDPQACAADLLVKDGDLSPEDGLSTAVMLSLFTDRRADPSDVLQGDDDLRGWWGDAVPLTDGDLVGSRLWLLAREKQSASVLSRAQQYAKEALQWLVDDHAVTSLDVTAEFLRPGGLGLTISVQRPRLPQQSAFRVTLPTLSAGAISFGSLDMPAGGVLG